MPRSHSLRTAPAFGFGHIPGAIHALEVIRKEVNAGARWVQDEIAHEPRPLLTPFGRQRLTRYAAIVPIRLAPLRDLE